jgi:hypothetical protein
VLAVYTTVIAVIAPVASDAAAHPLDGVQGANVRVVRTDTDASPFERSGMVWQEARRTAAPYLLHDADPLAPVAEAWARRFDGHGLEGHGVVGDLEVAVAATLARWRARSLDLPDYYIVVDAEGLRPSLRHWFLGVLGSAAPNRVVTGRPSVPVADHLAELRPGRWWPDLDRMLADIDHVVPDQAGPLAAVSAPAELVQPPHHLATH